MKNFRQLVKELPANKIVFAFGRFQPPTTGHELLVNAVKKVAHTQGADHIIYASRSQDKKANPLPVDRKVYYLKKMFPRTNFVAANDQIRTFIEAATALSKKYKHLVMLAGSDRVQEYKKILEKYNGDVFNFETIEVVSAGERDPDADSASGMSGTKMRDAAKKGDYQLFKKGLPHTLTEIDGKRLMNEIRTGLGLDAIKEQVKFETSDLREKYHAGEIYNIGDIVEANDQVYKIEKRGSNHLLLREQSGGLVSKWPHDVQPSTKEFVLQGPIQEMKFTSTDKIKVARIIAGTLGIEDVDKSGNPEQLINTALRKIRSKPMRPEYIDVLHNMLKTAQEAGIKYDEKLVPQKAQDVAEETVPYWKKPSWQKKMADAAKRERLAREKKEKEQQVKEGLGHGREDDEGQGRGKNPRKDFFKDRPHTVHVNGKPWKKFDNGHQAQKAADTLNAQGKKAVAIAHFKEESELEEAIKLNSKVKIHAPGKDYHGEVGHVGEIRHGAYKGAPKTYTVDYGDRKSVQLDKKNVKLHKEESELSESDNWEMKRIHGEYKHLKSLSTSEVHKKHQGLYKVTSKYTPAEVGGKQGMIDSIMHHRHGQKRMDAYHALPKKHKDALSEESELLEAIANASIMKKDTTELKKKLSQIRRYTDTGAEEIDPQVQVVNPVNIKDNESDIEAEVNPNAAPAVGHSLVSDNEGHAVRKMKVNYVREEAEEAEEDKEDTEEEISDAELDKMADEIDTEDDILDVYDDNELALVDDETGEEVEEDEEDKKVNEEALNEVLSRAERMRARARFAKTKSKRERKIKIVLKSRSDTKTLNSRARKLAVKLMKQRMTKKPLASLSVGEKERIERIMARRKAAINRLAMKLVPRVRKIEQKRLTHKTYTK